MQTLEIIYKYIFNKASLMFFVFLIIFTFDRHHRYEATVNPDLGPFESDVAEYYSYLPAFFYGTPEQLELNCKQNKRTIGMSVMYTPAFIAGDIIARSSGEKINGYSPPYQWPIRWGSILITISGLWFMRKSLLKFFNDTTTLITLVCIFFGTNLFYYTYSNGEMPHSYLFFFYSLFLYFSLKLILENKYKNIMWLGLIGGIIVLIRPTSGLIILFPLLFRITSLKDFKERIKILLFQHRLHAFWALILFAAPLLIQMIIWNKYHGDYIYYSYAGERFFFNDPQVINFLFSYQKGWLIYTPIMLFSLIGILLARKRLNDFFGFLILFMPLNIYILSCWWDWGFGGSFGCRPLIESYAILAFPFALFINWCFSLFLKFSVGKVILRAFLVILLFLLIKLNLFQTWQYKYLIIHWAGMNEKAYKYVFLKEKLTKDQLIYLHNSLVIDIDVEKRKNGIRD